MSRKMSASLIRSVLLAAAVGLVASEYDPEICSVLRESYGLIPPSLPTNFEFRGEHVDHVRKDAYYHEMAFDYRNSRGKYKSMHEGMEHHLLFDYAVQQIVEYYVIHPGSNPQADILSHTCRAVAMADSEDRVIFGLLDEDSTHPKMYTASQLMRFGGQYKFAYNGTDNDFLPERGILSDKFVGCVYDEDLDATMNMTYYFTNDKMVTAGGFFIKKDSGFIGGVASVPAKMEFFGSVMGIGDVPQLINRSMSWSYFMGEPEFRMDTFRIPPYMHCEDYLGRREMPKLPEAFSTRLQATSLLRDILGNLVSAEETTFEQIFYYKEKNLARRDFEPDTHMDTEIFSKFQSYSLVKTIYDFNQGLLYTTHQASGRCYVRTIGHGDYFEAAPDLAFVAMGSPEDVFRMHTDDMEFNGNDFARDIECNVWIGKYNDKVYNATFVKEAYMSTNGWHDDVDDLAEYGVPVKHTIIKRELGDQVMEGVSSYHFLKFKKSPPRLFSFDVSNCIGEIDHKDFALRLEIDDETRMLMYVYKSRFIETVQYYIADVSKLLTPLRVQKLQLALVRKPKSNLDFLLFTLVGKPVLHTKIPISAIGPSLDGAISALHNFIETGQFNMRFFFKGTKDEMVIVPAPRGSLYSKSASGNLTLYTDPRKVADRIEEKEPIIVFEEPVDEGKETKGMTSGNLVLLAFAMLFIGIGIGIAVMYLYIRRYSEKQMEDRITLSHKSAANTLNSEAGPSTSFQ